MLRVIILHSYISNGNEKIAIRRVLDGNSWLQAAFFQHYKGTEHYPVYTHPCAWFFAFVFSGFLADFFLHPDTFISKSVVFKVLNLGLVPLHLQH